MISNVLPAGFDWVNRFVKYGGNPVLRPGGFGPAADCVFNPGAVVHDGEVRLLCRCINFSDKCPDTNWSVSSLTWARSTDGVNFTLDSEPFLYPEEGSEYPGGFEDPRLVYIPDERTYMLTYTGVRSARSTPGLAAYSRDLVHWDFAGETFPARAVAVTNRKINGRYWAYYGNSSIFISWSDDLREWHTDREAVLSPRAGHFDSILCEAAGAPVVTDDGILLVYNGAAGADFRKKLTEGKCCFRAASSAVAYSVGWALFDRDDPKRLIARSDEPFLKPELPYELYGISEYTTFAEGMVDFKGKRFLYYGCSDTRIAAAISE